MSEKQVYYGYRLSEDGWTKMKTFKSIEEYQEYVAKKKIVWGLCSSKEIDLKGKALMTYDTNSHILRPEPRTSK